MRTILLMTTAASAALLSLLAPSPARAWDGPDLWYAPAAGKSPGGNGIIGTGGALDHNVTCAHCHMKAESKIDLKLDFTPPLPAVGGQPTYSPGQKYQVSVKLVGEHLGQSGCGQYLTHVNNFAATVENASGKLAGVLGSDSGQVSSSCPKDLPKPINGTTVLYGDCHAIISSGAENMATWSFSWTAPAAGSGGLTLYYGAVDGDCDMMSMNDDVKVGTIKLGEATASLAAPKGGSRSAMLVLGLVPIGLAARLRRRKAKRDQVGPRPT